MSDKENATNPFVENGEISEITIEEDKEDEKDKDNGEEKEQEESIEQKEDDLKKELDDINNKYLRLLADFDNYRKRQMTERESLLKYGAEDTLKKIIPVLDTLKRARESVEKTDDIGTVKQSYDVCTKQLNDVLTKIGLKEIEAKGKEFDPNIMEAVMQTPTDEFKPHTVIAELQTGYQLYDRVLRPVMVNVAVEKTEEDK